MTKEDIECPGLSLSASFLWDRLNQGSQPALETLKSHLAFYMGPHPCIANALRHQAVPSPAVSDVPMAYSLLTSCFLLVFFDFFQAVMSQSLLLDVGSS